MQSTEVHLLVNEGHTGRARPRAERKVRTSQIVEKFDFVNSEDQLNAHQLNVFFCNRQISYSDN